MFALLRALDASTHALVVYLFIPAEPLKTVVLPPLLHVLPRLPLFDAFPSRFPRGFSRRYSRAPRGAFTFSARFVENLRQYAVKFARDRSSTAEQTRFPPLPRVGAHRAAEPLA